jgi:hypothetical protein
MGSPTFVVTPPEETADMALAYYDHQFSGTRADDVSMARLPRQLGPRRSARRAPCALLRRPGRAFALRRAAAGAAIVVLVAVALCAAGPLARGVLGTGSAASPGIRSSPPDRAVVVRTVQPGDTLWDFAVSGDGPGDVRARVDELVRLNGGSLLRTGEPVRIPAEWMGGRS